MSQTAHPPIDTPTGPTRAELVRLREIITDDPLSWDAALKEEVTPWDHGNVQPPLRDLIQSGEIDFPRTGRGLVPGCGRGYDAILIASTLGLDILAVDVSPTAVQAGTDYLASLATPPLGKVSYKEQDFFSLKVSETERFDLMYDYTFFVAIPPRRRDEWGCQFNDLVKPGGCLITLIYPIDPQVEGGPPFYVRPEHYVEALSKSWDKVLDKIPEVSSKWHEGRERIVVWKRKLQPDSRSNLTGCCEVVAYHSRRLGLVCVELRAYFLSRPATGTCMRIQTSDIHS